MRERETENDYRMFYFITTSEMDVEMAYSPVSNIPIIVNYFVDV